MRKSFFFVVFCVLCGSCSWMFPPKKVECCEKTAACCYEHMCCLPRYAKAAGREPKPFTPEIPTYGTAQDLEPQPGETITKPGLLSRFNPFGGGVEDEQQRTNGAEPTQEENEDTGFFDRLLPF